MNTNTKVFLKKEDVTKLKSECQIVYYLANHGYEPIKKHGSEWLYVSIGANERSPSFYVNVKKNVYTDFSGNSEATGEKGDIIRLVQFLEGCTFLDACYRLSNAQFMPLNIAPPEPPEQEKKKIEIITVQSLRSCSLINYLESRKIGFKLADRYLKEVHYIAKDKKYYSLGFQNDKGGYALRNQLFKNQTQPQGFTTIKGTIKGVESDTVNVFEGFFNMLSCLQFYQSQCFKNTTYVLNSLSNLNILMPKINEDVKRINYFYDNDEKLSGQKSFEKIKSMDVWEVIPQNHIYKGYNDFNDFLCNR